ncbi:MAG TPA: NAD-dependent protein deacylase [Terriglobia bacterium]|nr:NAD-dependent protein deacylase [Terriglobia bacterium]
MPYGAQSRAVTPELGTVVQKLRDARNVLVLSGAGVSAESNIPTFRGEDGWWRSLNPAELATFAAFKRDPRLVWEWYDYRRGLIANASPNAGHRALAGLETPAREVFTVTQNVDDLHERAGSHQVVHIHGSIWEVICLKDGKTYEDRRVPLPGLPPTCACGGLLRPGVVWFGEALPATACAQVEDYFHKSWIDVALVIGTEATFSYIGDWALRAKRSGALLVEINPSPTVLTQYVDVKLEGKAGEILQEVKKGLSLNPGP